MNYSHINLRKYYPHLLKNDVFLDAFIYDNGFEYNGYVRQSVLILPGGGYDFISSREKDPIAFAFLALGYNAFTLSYSCHAMYPIPHLEVMCAVHYINRHAKEFNIRLNETTLIGFSAGAHLASTYAYLYKDLGKKKDYPLLKPYALVLAYPVISLIKSKNDVCIDNISHFNKKIMHLLSADEHVSRDYPPTFLWTTKNDQVVDPNNATWLVKELKKYKVKYKYNLYPKGPHGFALANLATFSNNKDFLNEEVSKWPLLAHQFISSIKEK